MTRAEIQARKAVAIEKVEQRRRDEAEKWLKVQTEYPTPRGVRWNEIGIWFGIWDPASGAYTTEMVPWNEVQATVVDGRP